MHLHAPHFSAVKLLKKATATLFLYTQTMHKVKEIAGFTEFWFNLQIVISAILRCIWDEILVH